MTASDRAAHLARLAAQCRKAGVALTPQRRAVFLALLGAKDHPTVEDVYGQVRRSMPTISLATVYKSLDSLVRIGAVHDIPFSGRGRRFDPTLDDHDHLVCRSCAAMKDVPVTVKRRTASKVNGFKVERLQVTLIGLCNECTAVAR